MSGDAERPADREAATRGGGDGEPRRPAGRRARLRRGATRRQRIRGAAGGGGVLGARLPAGRGGGRRRRAARYAAQAKAPAQLLWPYDPGLEDHADFRARLAAASEPAPVPKMLGIVEAVKAGGRRLSGIGSTKDLSHLAGAEGSVSTSGKSPGSTPGKAGRRRSSFELIGKGWAGLRGKRLSQIVVAAQKGEEKGSRRRRRAEDRSAVQSDARGVQRDGEGARRLDGQAPREIWEGAAPLVCAPRGRPHALL